MKMGYVVLEAGYEYNDEIYYQPEGGGGNPKAIYFDKSEAIKEVVRLSANALRARNPMDFGYEFADVSSLPVLEAATIMGNILDADITFSEEHHPPWFIACRREKHRLYTAIGEDCPCQPEDESPWGPPPWPRGVTDKQLAEIASEVFDRISFFYVNDVEIKEESIAG